ncbi:MAG: DsbA family protein [Nitriliruptorales bacterium]|nr:DsbA family protein [Nitriliruptorales bacterium]
MTQPDVVDLGLDAGRTRPDLEFVYVGDPMCSWCWGFAPVLEQLDRRYAIPMRTVVGGLRVGSGAGEIDDAMRDTLRHHWEQVEAASGQAFTEASLDRGGWRYDTEPSCRAVVTLRELDPDGVLAWMRRLHRAFYVEGVDITDPDVFPDLLDDADVDVDPDRFRERYHDPAMKDRTWEDFEEARSYGVMGFPTLLLRDGERFGIVTRGFVPYEDLEPALTAHLEDRYAEHADGLVCDPETGIC